MAKNLSAKKLYIDDEGVERGYHVYLHKDSTTGEVFYVGMGSGRRAWDKKPRGAGWQEKTNSLGNAWTVEIVIDDLSELEAFELERAKIMEYGGPAGAGGTLTNRWYGGDQPLAVTLSVQIPDFGWHEAYYAARRFRNVPRDEQERLVRDILARLEPTESTLSDLDFEGSESQDDSLCDSAGDVNNAVQNLIDASNNFLKKKISWKEFCMGVEAAKDELTFELPPGMPSHVYARLQPPPHARVRPLRDSALQSITALLQTIDSGNREETEDYAMKIAKDNETLLRGIEQKQ